MYADCCSAPPPQKKCWESLGSSWIKFDFASITVISTGYVGKDVEPAWRRVLSAPLDPLGQLLRGSRRSACGGKQHKEGGKSSVALPNRQVSRFWHHCEVMKKHQNCASLLGFPTIPAMAVPITEPATPKLSATPGVAPTPALVPLAMASAAYVTWINVQVIRCASVTVVISFFQLLPTVEPPPVRTRRTSSPQARRAARANSPFARATPISARWVGEKSCVFKSSVRFIGLVVGWCRGPVGCSIGSWTHQYMFVLCLSRSSVWTLPTSKSRVLLLQPLSMLRSSMDSQQPLLLPEWPQPQPRGVSLILSVSPTPTARVPQPSVEKTPDNTVSSNKNYSSMCM